MRKNIFIGVLLFAFAIYIGITNIDLSYGQTPIDYETEYVNSLIGDYELNVTNNESYQNHYIKIIDATKNMLVGEIGIDLNIGAQAREPQEWEKLNVFKFNLPFNTTSKKFTMTIKINPELSLTFIGYFVDWAGQSDISGVYMVNKSLTGAFIAVKHPAPKEKEDTFFPVDINEGSNDVVTKPVDNSNDSNTIASTIELKVNELINAERKKHGKPALKLRNDLIKVARAHSKDMSVRDFFSHSNPDGKDPFDRLEDAGITFSSAGENIFYLYNYPDPEEVAVEGWMNSPGHRSNILDSNNYGFVYTGIGVYESNGTYYFTQVFLKD